MDMDQYLDISSLYSEEVYASDVSYLSYGSDDSLDRPPPPQPVAPASTPDPEFADPEDIEQPPERHSYYNSPELVALPENEFRSDITDTCLTLIIGPENEQTKFCINKQLICHYSSILNFLLDESPKFEGALQTYRFPKRDHERAFSFLVQWLNTKKIPPLFHEAGFLANEPNLSADERQMLVADDDMGLVKAWLLADRFLIPELRKYIAKRIRFRFKHFGTGSVECLNYVYNNTSAEGPNGYLRYVYEPLLEAIGKPAHVPFQKVVRLGGGGVMVPIV